MHELSLLEDVLTIIEDNAERQGYLMVKKVSLEVGVLSCVEPDALRFAFEIVMKDSLADGAELEIVMVQGLAKCEHCGQETEIDAFHTPCPQCGQFKLTVIAGMDLRIRDLIVN